MSVSQNRVMLPLMVAFIGLASGVAARHVETVQCKGDKVEAAKVDFVDISPCDKVPCQLTNHNTYQFSISFKTGSSPATIKAATTHFYAIIDNVKVPWPHFNQTNACKDSGLSCPLEPSHNYLYSISLYIDSPLPITVLVEARIVDDATKKDLLCQLVQVKVTD